MRLDGNIMEDKILRIVSRHTDEEITPNSRLKNDLGLNSLNMMELCVDLEGEFGITIDEGMATAKTVQDLIDLVKSGNSKSAMPYDIANFPLTKTKKHMRRLKRFMRLSHLLWRFEVAGAENVPTDKNFILCPNHQSHFDGLWIWSAIKKQTDLSKICCLAKFEHLENKSSRNALAMLGGIPIDRRGNTVPAMKRGLECIQGGYTMLIHPEGTRTRDGKIHEFKGGAAKLAIDSGVPIVPVRIGGAWDIFPPHRKLPRVFRMGGRYPIRIAFGEPIRPNGKTVEELTAMLQREVERLGWDLQTD